MYTKQLVIGLVVLLQLLLWGYLLVLVWRTGLFVRSASLGKDVISGVYALAACAVLISAVTWWMSSRERLLLMLLSFSCLYLVLFATLNIVGKVGEIKEDKAIQAAPRDNTFNR